MVHTRRNVRLAALLMYASFCLICLRASGWAQVSTTAMIRGTVTDASGAVIANAPILVHNEATQVDTRTVSNESGSFAVPGLNSGSYDVTVTQPGYQAYKETQIVLSAAQVATVNAVLKVGQVTESVNVEAGAAQVQTSTPEISSQVTGTQASTLPLNGRNYQALSFLMPGVTNESPDTALNQGGFLTSNTISVNGMGINGTQYFLDGIWNMNTGSMNQTTITPNPDTIEEVRVLQNNYGSQYSLNGPNVLLLQTKSGTSTFHGTAFEYLRNDAFDARNYFSPTKTALKQNIFGYTVGGPIIKRDKAFFFWSEQWTNQHIANIVRGPDLTAAERNGTFPTAITDPTTGQPFPQNPDGTYQIPANRIDAQSLTFYNAVAPLPNNAAGGFLNYINTIPTINNTRDDEIKVDYNINSKLKAMGEYLDSHQTNNSATQNFGVSTLFSTTTQPITTPNQLAQARLTQTITPRLVNTTSVSMNNYIVNLDVAGLVNRTNIPGFESNMPYNGLLSGRLPEINFSGGWPTLGVSFILPLHHASDLEDTLSDDASWLKGNHLLQFGMQYVRGTKRQNAFAATAGEWMFSGQFTGNPMADFLLGDAESFNQQSTEIRSVQHYPIVSPYFQDQWKASRHLTVTLGIRYAWSPIPTFDNVVSNLIPSRFVQANAPIVNSNGVITVTPTYDPLNGLVLGGVTPGFPANYSNQRNNFWNPTVGFAYDVSGDGKTSLRGGVAMTHYFYFYASCSSQCPNNYPATVSTTIITPAFPNPIGGTVAPATVPPLHIQSQDFKEAQITNYSLSLQHQFRGNWLASIAGAGDVLLHGTINADANQPLPEGGFNFNPIINTGTVSEYAFGEPFPGYGQLADVVSPTTITWNALELNLQHPLSHGLFISGSYTWQRGFAATRDTETTSSYGGVQDFYHPNNDRGPSLTTPSQVFAFSAIWDLPWFASAKGLERTLLGGWEFANVTSIQSGFPMDPKLGTSNVGLATRPDLVPGVSISGAKTVNEWFNTSAFVPPPPGFFGTAPNGSIIGPGTIDFDMSFYKNFKVTERTKLQFRSNFYNIFNHTNFNGVATTLGAGDFGQVISARDPRIIEFALRFEF
jgi:Carboxypeptidase regulatory-like domain/TonB-dependent Receptor Plug Domain